MSADLQEHAEAAAPDLSTDRPAPASAASSKRRPRRRTTPATLGVLDAVSSGDERDILLALRKRLAVAISDPDCSPRDLAALSNRLQDISEQIARYDAGNSSDNSRSDELWSPETI